MVRVGVVLCLLAVVAGCGGSKVSFHYPAESLVFPHEGQPPALYVELVNDLRPGSQREGEGSLLDINFPADENWDMAVGQVYYQALLQDLTQTNLVEVVPLRSQADFVLEVDLLHMGCKVKRNGMGFALAGLAGGGIGYLIGQSGGAAAIGAVVGLGAVPVPTVMKAACEVNLRVYDHERELFYDRTCLGEITKNRWEGMTSRKDQEWVDEYLTVAVKRCNACLLGQLRQALIEAETETVPQP
jgi:hypothetical protein